MPVFLSIACPTTSRLFFETPAGNVSRNNVSPQTAMPPCPSFGSGWCHTMFVLAATLHDVGAFATSTRQLPLGPPAWGQLATPPSAAGGGTEASSVDGVSGPTAVPEVAPAPVPPVPLVPEPVGTEPVELAPLSPAVSAELPPAAPPDLSPAVPPVLVPVAVPAAHPAATEASNGKIALLTL